MDRKRLLLIKLKSVDSLQIPNYIDVSDAVAAIQIECGASCVRSRTSRLRPEKSKRSENEIFCQFSLSFDNWYTTFDIANPAQFSRKQHRPKNVKATLLLKLNSDEKENPRDSVNLLNGPAYKVDLPRNEFFGIGTAVISIENQRDASALQRFSFHYTKVWQNVISHVLRAGGQPQGKRYFRFPRKLSWTNTNEYTLPHVVANIGSVADGQLPPSPQNSDLSDFSQREEEIDDNSHASNSTVRDSSDEFEFSVDGPLPQRNIIRICSKIKAHIANTSEAQDWKTSATEGKGYVTHKEFETLLFKLGAACTRKEFQILIRYFDSETSGKIKIKDVTKFLKWINPRLNSKKSKRRSDEYESDDTSISGMSHLKVGDTVEAQYMEGADWFSGTVERKNRKSKTVEIQYVDGSNEQYVPLHRIRIPKTQVNEEHISSLDSPKINKRESPRGYTKRQTRIRSGSPKEDYTAPEPKGYSTLGNDEQTDDDSVDETASEGSAAEALAQIREAIISKKSDKSISFSFANVLEQEADIPSRRQEMTVSALKNSLRAIKVRLRRPAGESLLRRLQRSNGNVHWPTLVNLIEIGDGTIDCSAEMLLNHSNDIIKTLQAAIKRSLRSGLVVSEAFELFDPHRTNLVSCKDFIRALALLGCHISENDVRLLRNRICMIAPNTPKGRIDYGEVLKLVKSCSMSTIYSTKMKKKQTVMATDVSQAVERVRRIIRESCEERKEKIDIEGKLSGMDSEGKGYITRFQLLSGLKEMGLCIPIEDIDMCLTKCVPDSGQRRGSISRSVARTMVDYVKFAKLVLNDAALAAALLPQLRRASSRGLSAFAAFRSVDNAKVGHLSRVEFRKICLQTLGLRMREVEMRYLMEKFSVPDTKANHRQRKRLRVNYVDFLNFIAPNGEAGSIGDDLSGLDAKIKQSIRTLISGYQNGNVRSSKDLLEELEKYNLGNDTLSRAGLFEALKRIGLELSEYEKRQILARFDPHDENRIKLSSFVKYAGFDEFEMDEIAFRILQRFREVREDGVDYRVAFELFDSDRTGFINRREFKYAARSLALPLTQGELFSLMGRFSVFNDKDKILYRDFLSFVVNRQDRSKQQAFAEMVQERDRMMRAKIRKSGKNQRSTNSDDDKADVRLVKNGSGYDGLGLEDPYSRNLMKPLININENTMNLEADKFCPTLEKAIEIYRKENDDGAKNSSRNTNTLENFLCNDPTIFYNHSEKTVNQIVDHSNASKALESLKETLAESWLSSFREEETSPLSDTFHYPISSKLSKSLDELTKSYPADRQIENNNFRGTSAGSDIDKVRYILEDPLTFAKLILSETGKSRKPKKKSGRNRHTDYSSDRSTSTKSSTSTASSASVKSHQRKSKKKYKRRKKHMQYPDSESSASVRVSPKQKRRQRMSKWSRLKIEDDSSNSESEAKCEKSENDNVSSDGDYEYSRRKDKRNHQRNANSRRASPRSKAIRTGYSSESFDPIRTEFRRQKNHGSSCHLKEFDEEPRKYRSQFAHKWKCPIVLAFVQTQAQGHVESSKTDNQKQCQEKQHSYSV